MNTTTQSLDTARSRVMSALAACSVYVDARAGEGDAVAAELAREVRAAFDQMRLENHAGAALLADRGTVEVDN